MQQVRFRALPNQLAFALSLLSLTATCMVAIAQEQPKPLQFNVPYRCSDGITYIVHRCEPKGHGEVCFWREEKNGQLVTEAFSVRGQTAARVQACRVESGTPAGQPGQTPNPPYLSEMPTEERVMREIQGADQIDTAARQAGAFWQLQQIIYTMLGPGRSRNQLTPDEQRLIGVYYAAYYRVWQPLEKSLSQDRPRLFKLQGYTLDPRFRNELFNRFFSPAFRAQYEKVDAAFAARHQEFVKAQEDAQKQAQANAAAAQAQQAENAKDQQAVARCISAGRSEFDCLGETMKKEVGGMLGAVDPRLKQEFTTAPGLRVSGLYGASGVALLFPQDQDFVSLGCGELVMEPHSYTVENTGSRIILKIANEPQTLVLAFNPNGNLTGPGPVDVKGKVVVGYTTGSVATFDDHGNIIGHHDVTVPIYKEKVEHCNAGTLALKGAAPALSATSVLTSLAIFQQSAKTATGSKDFKVPPGLRLIGDYAGQSGFTVEFRRESATVGCGQAVAAHSYTIQSTGSQVLAKIGDDGSPHCSCLARRWKDLGLGTSPYIRTRAGRRKAGPDGREQGPTRFRSHERRLHRRDARADDGLNSDAVRSGSRVRRTLPCTRPDRFRQQRRSTHRLPLVQPEQRVTPCCHSRMDSRLNRALLTPSPPGTASAC